MRGKSPSLHWSSHNNLIDCHIATSSDFIHLDFHSQSSEAHCNSCSVELCRRKKRQMSDSTVTDDDLVENDSSRVLGVGSGTFAVAILFFSTVLVWIFTTPQTEPLKSVIRSVVTLMFVTIFAILLLADRESQYQSSTGDVVKVIFLLRFISTPCSLMQVYDTTVGPRMAIGSLLIFSSFISGIMVFLAQFSTPYQASSQIVDPAALWQE
jgi:hypothetical protein